MGIYYRTVFYKDIRNKNDFVILSELSTIVEACDKERGYIIKDKLVKFYGNKIHPEDIGKYSRIEEQIGSSHGPNYDVETILPIHF